jgi:hypothetical protein
LRWPTHAGHIGGAWDGRVELGNIGHVIVIYGQKKPCVVILVSLNLGRGELSSRNKIIDKHTQKMV